MVFTESMNWVPVKPWKKKLPATERSDVEVEMTDGAMNELILGFCEKIYVKDRKKLKLSTR